MEFALPADHRGKVKENEKKDKHFDLVRVLKKLLNMKVMFIPVVIVALDTVTDGFLKGLKNLEI